jgi:hypothetical protein
MRASVMDVFLLSNYFNFGYGNSRDDTILVDYDWLIAVWRVLFYYAGMRRKLDD